MPEGGDKDRIWEALNALREEQSKHRERNAAIESRMESLEARMVDSHERMITHMTKLEQNLQANTEAVNKARGGLRVGPWVAGIVISLNGIGMAIARFVR